MISETRSMRLPSAVANGFQKRIMQGRHYFAGVSTAHVGLARLAVICPRLLALAAALTYLPDRDRDDLDGFLEEIARQGINGFQEHFCQALEASEEDAEDLVRELVRTARRWKVGTLNASEALGIIPAVNKGAA